MSLSSASVLVHLRKLRGERSKPKAKAGWFADPRKLAPYRFWDGSSWTAETRDQLPTQTETSD